MSRAERIDLTEFGTAEAPALEARIRAARLVCFPTDTVYGVGGALTAAVARALVAAKGRDPAKPLQVVFPSLESLEAAVETAPALRDACRRLLPGPLTLLLPYPAGWAFPPPGESPAMAGRESGSAAAGTGPGSGAPVPTLGVRVPAWPPAARVMGALELPLVASSANPSGAPAPATLGAVEPALLARCDLALDAGPVGGEASTVVDLSRYASAGTWTVVRAGALAPDRVAARLAGEPEEGCPA